VEDQHLSHPRQLVVLIPAWKNVPSPAEAAPSDALPFFAYSPFVVDFFAREI
jgi:hypothetical protein